jgi:hypothetical protein
VFEAKFEPKKGNVMSDFQNLAKLIKEAAKVREESFKKCDKVYNSLYTGDYTLSIDEACEKVAKEMGINKQFSSLASLMLFAYWNDALDWADTQLYPDEMLFVEACYSVCNQLYMGGVDLDTSSINRLAKDFSNSAETMRKSLYGFGDEALTES